MSLLGKVSTNGPGFVRTGEFKKRVAREERLVERGDMVRIGGIGGELPVEAEARRSRKMLCMEDLRLALQLGDGYLGQTPLIAGGICNSRCLDTEGIEDLYETKHLTNGDANGGGEVWSVQFDSGLGGGEPMQIDGEEGWIGGGVDEGQDLDGVLDDVLNLADL
jgi:transcriptional coactivator HFI1/ADA1